MRGEIAEFKAQDESDRMDFQLQLGGVRKVKAPRAILADYGGDVDILKEVEPWCLTLPPSSRAERPGFPTLVPARTPERP